MYSALSTLNTTTEVRPLSKGPNLQLLPGRRSINGCPLLRVCVYGVCVCTLDGLNAEHKFRVWVTILDHISRHFHFHFSLHREGLKSCSARKVPLLKKAHVQARLKFANDSEENWVKVLWSDETKMSSLASTQLAVFGGGGMLPMTPRTHPHRQTWWWKHYALGVFFC